MAEELEDTIQRIAQEPKSMSNDSGSATGQDIDKVIEADRYKKANAAASSGLGLRFVKLIPPGAD